jgi:hypothetical protein
MKIGTWLSLLFLSNRREAMIPMALASLRSSKPPRVFARKSDFSSPQIQGYLGWCAGTTRTLRASRLSNLPLPRRLDALVSHSG